MDEEDCVREVMKTGRARSWAIVLIVNATVATGAGVGGTYWYGTTNPELTRPDPFTGTQGKQLELRIIELEREIADIKTRLLIEERFRRSHP